MHVNQNSKGIDYQTFFHLAIGIDRKKILQV